MVKLGHYYDSDKSCFRIYAPYRKTVEVELNNGKTKFNLNLDKDGYWTGSCNRLPEGSLYWIILDGERSYPDPASKYQPFGVHSGSMIVNPKKGDLTNWHGVKMEDAVIYEMHLGTFTKEGTIKAAEAKLQYLADLGINVIELMPIGEFPGNYDWGYDGVFIYALESSYGTYEDLRKFLNKAHELGIAVINDVVYNHFGPEGNYTGFYAQYTKDADTPWGSAINYDSKDCSGVREFFLGNVEWWLRDIGFDGFRLDAWSMILDCSESRIQREICDLAHKIGKEENREILMIAEHLRNDKNVTSAEDNGDACDSQWVDDFGLSIRAFLTPDSNDRLFKSFAPNPFKDIITSLKQTYVLDGSRFNYAIEDYSGTKPEGVKPHQCVIYIQDHDMIGNRVKGDRFISSAGRDKTLLAAVTLFSSKNIPLIFMGEEYGETNPFLFFESFSDPWLIEAVREGRKKEWQFSKIEPRDSHDVETFNDSRLDWDKLSNDENRQILSVYQNLIKLKKSKVIGYTGEDSIYEVENDENTIVINNGRSRVLLNFSSAVKNFDGVDGLKVILSTNPANTNNQLQPYSAVILSNY